MQILIYAGNKQCLAGATYVYIYIYKSSFVASVKIFESADKDKTSSDSFIKYF